MTTRLGQDSMRLRRVSRRPFWLVIALKLLSCSLDHGQYLMQYRRATLVGRVSSGVLAVFVPV